MNTLSLVLLLTVVGVAVYAALIEPRLIELRHQPILIPRLPNGLDGLRILHISDLHIKDSHRGKARQLLRMSRQAKPDLVIITGDLIDDSSNIEYAARFISRLRAVHGVIAILGNHDHYHYSFTDTWGRRDEGSAKNDAVTLAETLREREVSMLINEPLRLKIHGEPLWLVGVDEYSEGYDKAQEIMAEIPPEEMLLYLAHKPDMVNDVTIRKPALAMAGHTHGGQIRLPGLGGIIPHSKVVDRKNNSGLTTIGGLPVHISRGFGSSQWFPFRFLCRPEISLITLKRI